MLGMIRQSGAGQNLPIGAASVASTVAPAGTFAVRLSAISGNCHVAFGTTPVAVATDMLIKSSDPSQLYSIQPGEKVAEIQDGASTGTLNVIFVTQ